MMREYGSESSSGNTPLPLLVAFTPYGTRDVLDKITLTSHQSPGSAPSM